jgi:hypothetical protein
MSHVILSVSGTCARALPAGYEIVACGVSWRPGQRAITPPAASRIAFCTTGKLAFAVPSA